MHSVVIINSNNTFKNVENNAQFMPISRVSFIKTPCGCKYTHFLKWLALQYFFLFQTSDLFQTSKYVGDLVLWASS